MKLALKDLLQMSKDHNQIWPSDLVNDLEEEEPHVFLQSKTFTQLILDRVKNIKNDPPELEDIMPPLPSLVTPGWDNTKIKGTQNWADFENLILFYTIGKLDIPNTPDNIQQKEQDLAELRTVIEEFRPLKGQKKQSAEKRVGANTTYLAFGKKTIDNLLTNNPNMRHEMQREIEDANEANYFNGCKLEKSYHIALRVFHTLQDRYRQG